MIKEEWAKLIDFTCLKNPISRVEAVDFFKAALNYNARGICSRLSFFQSIIFPYLTSEIAQARKKGIFFVSVIDFPDGNGGIQKKKQEAELAKQMGIDEVDIVMNVEAFKKSNYQLVEDEIKAVTDVFGKNTKVIIETGALGNWQIPLACEIINSVGAGYVKTSTGFNFNIDFDEKLKQVEFIHKIIQKEKYNFKLKMSGGLEKLEQLEKAKLVGADIFGISWQKAVNILENLDEYSRQQEVVREENEAMIEFLKQKP